MAEVVLGKIAAAVGLHAVKQLRRAHAFDKHVAGKQLLVVQPSNWVFAVLCQYKRYEQQLIVKKMLRATRLSVDEVKAKYLSQILAKSQHKMVDGIQAELNLSEGVLILTSAISETWPQFEPLLVELAFVHCVREWSHAKCAPADVAGFEQFLLSELQGKNATNWFGCQFFIDSLDLLTLAPFFYKERIANQAVKDLMSICIVESHNDFEACTKLMMERMAKEKNKAARDGWTAWLGQEIATVGSPTRSMNSSNFSFLSNALLNPTQLQPDLRGYFPIGVVIRGFGSRECHDLCAYILTQSGVTNWYAPGFIYEATAQ